MVTLVHVPKQVDHDQRRREIIRALFRVATRDGLAAVSIRNVAAEAGVRAPQVQYYFGTKAALFDGAVQVLGERVVGRGLALQQAAGPDASPELLIRAALTGSQPTDDETRESLVLFFLFYVAAVTESAGHDTQLVDAQRFIVDYFAGLIRQAQQRGEADPGLVAEHEARLILFANTGLIMGALAGIHPVDDAVATMDYHVARVFTRPAVDR
jgi:TetR/AcrR family transcriptional regulator, transcriptional repressor of bet genes